MPNRGNFKVVVGMEEGFNFFFITCHIIQEHDYRHLNILSKMEIPLSLNKPVDARTEPFMIRYWQHIFLNDLILPCSNSIHILNNVKIRQTEEARPW